MRGRGWITLTYWLVLVALTLVMLSGCQGGPSRRTLASAEPTLSPSVSSGAVVADGGTSVAAGPSTVVPGSTRTATFADRHPLFSRPREYYESVGTNKVVKTAAAVVVGVPAGI